MLFLSTPSARRATIKKADDGRDDGKQFLSTPSARRATLCVAPEKTCYFYFYPRPPRGGRRSGCGPDSCPSPISIHALREEGDIWQFFCHWLCRNFYPRPPRGGRPHRPVKNIAQTANFYPRPPRGGRPLSQAWYIDSNIFLSTPSARRATIDSYGLYPCIRISIHALREEGDSQWWQA